MIAKDDIAIIYQSGENPTMAKEMIRDNKKTMQREFLDLHDNVLYAIPAQVVIREEYEHPWGYWFNDNNDK